MKIGIFTHYYLSNNYGGNLQAYALCKVLNNLGHNAEQVCYLPWAASNESLLRKIYHKFKYKVKRIIIESKNRTVYRSLKARKKAILGFNINVIPHSDKVYDDQSLSKINGCYDCFITGSDQVWHPDIQCSGYLLEFCNDPSKKIAYAASIASDRIKPEAAERLKKTVATFSHISVRESDSVEVIKSLGYENCEWVLDPTLLLSASEWRSISKPLKIERDYVLTYFLGENEVSRQGAIEYAKKNNLFLVSIPFLLGEYRQCDDNYGDVQLYSVSPEQFLFLVEHADTVFTDSFHAVVFSLIFSKNFFVFNRDHTDNMTNRIHSLLNLFDLSDRFITNEKIQDVNSKDNVNYKYSEKFEEIKKRSFDFLSDALN